MPKSFRAFNRGLLNWKSKKFVFLVRKMFLNNPKSLVTHFSAKTSGVFLFRFIDFTFVVLARKIHHNRASRRNFFTCFRNFSKRVFCFVFSFVLIFIRKVVKFTSCFFHSFAAVLWCFLCFCLSPKWLIWNHVCGDACGGFNFGLTFFWRVWQLNRE